MITLSDAAEALERICDTVSSADEITEEMLNLFQINQQNVAQEVDRAFRYKAYLESQRDYALSMEVKWGNRKEKMEQLLDKLKHAALAVAKSTQVPLKGDHGKITIRKNSRPSINYELGFRPDPEYVRTRSFTSLDKDKMREDLEAGKEIPGASLEWGEHVRFTM